MKTCTVVGGLRHRDGVPKLSGRRFIKQASSDSVDWSPKANLICYHFIRQKSKWLMNKTYLLSLMRFSKTLNEDMFINKQ
jgi:hypothetical protein